MPSIKERRNIAMDRHRTKLSKDKKRVEFWLDQPECLNVLARQSKLNRTRALNALIEIVSDGMDAAYDDREERTRYMLKLIVETFG